MILLRSEIKQGFMFLYVKIIDRETEHTVEKSTHTHLFVLFGYMHYPTKRVEQTELVRMEAADFPENVHMFVVCTAADIMLMEEAFRFLLHPSHLNPGVTSVNTPSLSPDHQEGGHEETKSRVKKRFSKIFKSLLPTLSSALLASVEFLEFFRG